MYTNHTAIVKQECMPKNQKKILKEDNYVTKVSHKTSTLSRSGEALSLKSVWLVAPEK